MRKRKRTPKTFKSILEFEAEFFPKLSQARKDRPGESPQRIASRFVEESLASIRQKITRSLSV